MAYTEVTTTGYGNRIVNSIKGVVVGIILFFASFGLLFWNEGRMDLSLIAKTAVDIPSDKSAEASLDGKLVSTSGVMTTAETLGDDQFLKPGKYLAYEREVEMYAWVEHEKEESKTNVGGSETTTKTYIYNLEWVEDVPDSSKFKVTEGHQNPSKTIQNKDARVTSATVGVFPVDPKELELPSTSALSLSETNVEPSQGFEITEGKDYLFWGTGSIASPELGDLRVSYQTLPSDLPVVVFGKLDGDKISPFLDEKDNRLYRAFTGTRDQAIATLHTEFVIMTWILRIVGFIMMWVGLSLLLAPLSTFLDVLPFLGGLSRSMVGLLTFLVALVLSIVTIIVSAIVHSLIASIIAVLVGLIVFFIIFKMMKKKPAAATPKAA